MKHAKGGGKEEDDCALFASPSNKKMLKKAFKGRYGYCGEFGHKAADCPNKKSNQNKGKKAKPQQKKKQHGKGDSKGKRHLDMSQIKCFNCGEYRHFSHDCPRHMIMLILLDKVSKRVNWNLFWIWIVLLYAMSVQWFVQNYTMKMQIKVK